jgi:hypothetical protein
MKSFLGWVLTPLLVVLGIALIPDSARAQYKAESNPILQVGNRVRY